MEHSQTSHRQNIEQERARVAWQQVLGIKNDRTTSALQKEYRTQVRKLNAMIQINGLGQALGFHYAKSEAKPKEGQTGPRKTEHYHLLDHLSQWMRTHFKAKNSDQIGPDFDGLLHWVTHEDTNSADYRRATTECLAFGTWLSRFAEAELEGDDES
jgi:CRISPR-associated protein Cmr5